MKPTLNSTTKGIKHHKKSWNCKTIYVNREMDWGCEFLRTRLGGDDSDLQLEDGSKLSIPNPNP